MTTQTQQDFMESYAPPERPIITVHEGGVEIRQGDNLTFIELRTDEFQPFVIVQGRRGRTALFDPILGFRDDTPYLNVDVHAFDGGDDTAVGVMGMANGRQFEMEGPTEKAAPGWNAARLVALFVGRFAS